MLKRVFVLWVRGLGCTLTVTHLDISTHSSHYYNDHYIRISGGRIITLETAAFKLE